MARLTKQTEKFLFLNKLKSLSPAAPIKSPPTYITTSIVDAMRVARIITIKDTNPPLFLTWERKVFVHIERLPTIAKMIHFLIHLKDVL